MKLLRLMLVFLFCVGCDNLSNLHAKKKIGSLKTLINGESVVYVHLPKIAAGWNVWFFDPSNYNNIIKRNNVLNDEVLTIQIQNINKNDLYLWTDNSEIKIKQDMRYQWFSGKFKRLLTNKGPVRVHSVEGKINFKLIVKFNNRDFQLDKPIPIIAEWSDAL